MWFLAKNREALWNSADDNVVAHSWPGGSFCWVMIIPGAYPNALGFDEKHKLIYAQNFEIDLVVYNHGGAKLGEYEMAALAE